MTLHRRAITLWWGCHHAPASYALSPPPLPPQSIPKNSFATSSDPKSEPPRDHQWPTCANPTPYDIFHLRKGDTYSKTRFYHLVKLYHPDKHIHVSIKGLSAAARLERYRLVVLAHTILSDPHKRRDYDLYGAGWGPSRVSTGDARTADRNWRRQPGSAAGNATWEDWEQWYAMRDGRQPPQAPVYMSNVAFAFLIVMFVAVGGITQASRAEARGADILDVRREHHAAISEGMMRRAAASSGRSPTDRVETFLRERENTAYQYEPSRYETAEPEKPLK